MRALEAEVAGCAPALDRRARERLVAVRALDVEAPAPDSTSLTAACTRRRPSPLIVALAPCQRERNMLAEWIRRPSGLRLAAEALGTFLFFFLGFNAIAVSVTSAAVRSPALGIAFAFGLGLALAITEPRTGLRRSLQSRRSPSGSLWREGSRRRSVGLYWVVPARRRVVAVLAVAAVYSRACDRARSTRRQASESRTEARSCSRLIATALLRHG